jgi:hypothetical protein
MGKGLGGGFCKGTSDPNIQKWPSKLLLGNDLKHL